MAKGIIQNTSVTRKEYAYELPKVRLAFTLRQDNTDELVPFESLLKKALEDVQKDMKVIQDSRVSKRKK